MAKLEIRLKEEAKKKIADKKRHSMYVPKFSDYDILIDGHEPQLLTSVELSFDNESFPHAKLSFLVDDLKVDGEFLTALKAKIEDDKKSEIEAAKRHYFG
ncbi:hypothetical protein [Sporolactobacillus terrae]|uniref:hypothetical protein n=1 Tax=Sporolactobacillus terrae TaxID=269673 RepID=UPI0006881561|nr:hypothetical protein [Sporolactobacillus terrae]